MDQFRNAVLQFSCWVLATGLAVAFVVWRYHYGEHFETGIIGQKQLTGVDRVWFSRDGALFAAQRTPEGLTIAQFSPAPGETAGFHRGKSLVSRRRDAPYAISPDGDAIAWANRSAITILYLTGEQSFGRNTSATSDIRHLAWMDGSVIIAVHSEGRIEALDATSLRCRATLLTELEQPAAIAASGTFIALASRDRRRIRVLDIRMLPQISEVGSHDLQTSFTSFAVSREGQIAAGTDAGPVISALVNPGFDRNTAVEFYDESRVLVAGAGGMVLVGHESRPMRIPNIPPNVTSLALADNHLAVASDAGIALLTARISPPLSHAGWSIIWRWLAVTAIIGMLLVVRALFLRASHVRPHGGDRIAGIASQH